MVLKWRRINAFLDWLVSRWKFLKNFTMKDVLAPERRALKGIRDNVRSSLLPEIYKSI